MSAIGDYIHYTSKGYIEHGTTHNGNFTSWMSQKQDIFSRLKANQATSLSQEEQEDLAGLLTSMIKNEGNNPDISKVHSEIEGRMSEIFGETLQDINWETGNVDWSKNKGSVIGKVQASHSIDSAVKKIDTLEEIIRQEAQKQPPKRGALSKIKELRKEYRNVAKEIKKFKEENGVKAGKELEVEKQKDLRKQRSELNQLIAEYAAYPAVALQKGTLFEHLISYAPTVARNEAETAIGQVIGDVTEGVVFNKSAFAGEYLTKQMKDLLEKTTVSQGKIDVSISWSGKNLGISAKNYDLSRYYVHVLSGSSLLYMLQDINPDFVNHFLNLYAAHGKNRDDSNSSSWDGLLASKKSDILQEIKLILMYKALTGDNNQRSSANLFIINDSNTGNVRVLDMFTLIDRISKEPIQGIKIGDKTFNEKIKFRNDWNNASAQARISGLLMDVHSRKVTASINTKFIK